MHASVTLTGGLFGPMRLAALGAAAVFVLPSFSEGFSLAILEALACRLPVLITPGCNFPEVAQSAAGLEVQPNADDTERGLRQLLSMADRERAAMGANGRAMIESQYTWDAVARRMVELYSWLLGKLSRPSFVVCT